jgi:hypothetical protein
MALKKHFELDFSDFNVKHSKSTQRIIRYAKIGVREAAQEWKHDADNVPPRTPHLTGFLRGSGVVSNIKATASEICAEVTYSAPYAKKWHEWEGPVNWSEEGVGPKYLESKIFTFGKKYVAIIADAIRKGARGG